MLTGENNILAKANLAKQMSNISNEQEVIQLNMIRANMEEKLDNSNKYYIGEPLYDKILENGDKWNIVVNNNTLEKYGTGWNYILNGTEIIDYGKTQYDWVVNYNDGDIVQIDSNYTVLSYKSALAVTDDLVLNIDLTNLQNDNWGNIIKHGDVRYSNENKSLYFDGDGDYLELTKQSDFSNGFTFEIYANLDRLCYSGSSINNKCFGIFCKMPNINYNATESMRFGFTDINTICKFNFTSSWYNNGFNMSTLNSGDVISNSCGYQIGEDVYLTFVYRRYDFSNPQWSEVADRVEYYINGELYGYTYYGIDSYNEGCKVWNGNNSNFYLGVCPWYANGNLYYLKGNVYCTRLYEIALSSDEVNKNVTKTKLYRNINL